MTVTEPCDQLRKRNTIPKYREKSECKRRERENEDVIGQPPPTPLTQPVVRNAPHVARLALASAHSRRTRASGSQSSRHSTDACRLIIPLAPFGLARASDECLLHETRATLNYNSKCTMLFICDLHSDSSRIRRKKNVKVLLYSQRRKGGKGRTESVFRLNGTTRSIRYSSRG